MKRRRKQRNSVERAVQTFLGQLADSTRRAYLQKLDYFRLWLEVRDVPAAAQALRRMGPGEATRTVEEFRSHLARTMAPGSVNTYLAVIRSMLRALGRYGLVTWRIEVPGLPTEPYRDTRGPGRDVVVAMLERAARRTDAKGARDMAILRLLYDIALRRCEVCRLDYADVDLDAPAVAVLGKKRRERVWVALPDPTSEALTKWIDARGVEPGPLFVSLARNTPRRRIDGVDVYRIVRAYGTAVGHRVTPHGLRHAAVTRALELVGGNIRVVQVYARHARPDTTTIYDDKRRGLGYEAAASVAEDAEVEKKK